VTGQGVVYELREEEIVLGDRDGKAALGVWQLTGDDKGLINSVLKLFEKMKNPSLHYETNLGDIGWFIYYLLWWIVVINILVALFNMLPLGILDGGRFFYLTIWGITGKEKLGKKAYSIITWALLAMLALMMVKWVFRFF
jgi:membrane-associated protease RseP (regulator of RpoE activity)